MEASKSYSPLILGLMEAKGKRRWPWIAGAVVAVPLIVVLWPKQDPYSFLRHFRPNEHVDQTWSTETGSTAPAAPDGFARIFDFKAPVPEVYKEVAAHWKPESPGDPWGYGTTQAWFVGPRGAKICLGRNVPVQPDGVTCSLVFWNVDPPTWIERQLNAVKTWLHLQ